MGGSFNQMRSGIIVRDNVHLAAHPLLLHTLLQAPALCFGEQRLNHRVIIQIDSCQIERDSTGKSTNAGYSASYSLALESFPNRKSAQCKRMSLFVAFYSSWGEIIESAHIYTQILWHLLSQLAVDHVPA